MITTGEVFLSHDGASFGNKMMWVPVAVIPLIVPAGIAAVFSRTGGEDGAPAGLGGGGPERPPGDLPALAGCGAEARGRSATSATTWRWGPRRSLRCWPRWSAGWASWPLCCGARATSAPAATRRRGDHARRNAALPRIRCPGPGRALGPGHRRRGPGPARPTTELSFFTEAEQATAGPLFDLLLDQREPPRFPSSSWSTTGLALDETDGWFYDDLPEDPKAWRMTLALLDGDARRPAWRQVPRPRHRCPVRSRPGGAGRRVVARHRRRPRLVAVDPLRLLGVLLPSVGVERDRVRRAGLSAGLPGPWGSASSSTGRCRDDRPSPAGSGRTRTPTPTPTGDGWDRARGGPRVTARFTDAVRRAERVGLAASRRAGADQPRPTP